jgi:ubiquinone/menaquinone biosynthesis C-methylase UbiE
VNQRNYTLFRGAIINMSDYNKIKKRFNQEILKGRLNKIEFWAMNNAVRRWLQRNVELKVFQRFLKKQNIDLNNKAILDAGCGSGYSTEIISKIFNPSKIIAFDLMPEQIKLAQKRRTDAVFIFGVIHHVCSWKKALKEISRVLKNRGALLIEEPRVIFKWNEFENELNSIGYEILEKAKLMGNYFKSYLCILK